MKFVTFVSLVCVFLAVGSSERIIRREIHSSPTASTLGRIRRVTVRSSENGAVTEISSKEAANFGHRSANESSPAAPSQAQTKTKIASSAAPSTTSPPPPSTTTSTTSTTSTTPATPPKAAQPETSKPKNKASERQLAQPEVETLSSAQSSWQAMTAVEAPAAMLIATGARADGADLSASSTNRDFLRASSTKGSASAYSQESEIGESFSRLRQQQTTTKQQNSFYPAQPAPIRSKTSPPSTKGQWYKPTPRPAPIIQEEQQYEQVEQQAEYNAAPPGQAEPFAFDFNTRDSNGNGQYRKEESDKNGVVHGSYGYTDANGIYRHVEYVADQNGFRANIKSNEPGLNGETQPASIQLAANGAQPARITANSEESNTGEESGNWSELNNAESTAAVSPNFQTAHKPERLRAARHFRN